MEWLETESPWAAAAADQVIKRRGFESREQLELPLERPTSPSPASVPQGAATDLKPPVGVKAPLAHVPVALMTYDARAHQYGADKYLLGNYLRANPEGPLTAALGYSSALMRHVTAFNDSVIRHIGEGVGYNVTQEAAAYAADAESGLPHLAHAAASLGMLIQKLVDAGLLPADPGITWGSR